MVRKPKLDSDVPNPSSVANRDIIQRLNFLYQASSYLSSIPDHHVPHPRTGKTYSTRDLARVYTQSMKVVGKKTLVKMDPAVKRTVCKACNAVLLPGLTATVRTKTSSSHGHAVTYTCASCSTSRRIPAPPTLFAPPGQSVHPQISVNVDQTAPADEEAAGNASRAWAGAGKPSKKALVPRLPPLFARDCGHVTFCGNERLPVEVVETSSLD